MNRKQEYSKQLSSINRLVFSIRSRVGTRTSFAKWVFNLFYF
jgi:hypothetical protein